MRIGFLIGWILFACGFVLTAIQQVRGHEFFESIDTVLKSLDAGAWIAFKIRHGGPLFDNTIAQLIKLPGWLVFWVPSGILFWIFRPHRTEMDAAHEESLGTYDRLAKLAEEEGAADDSGHWQDYDLSDYDTTNVRGLESADRYMEEWDPHAGDGNPDQKP